jgi:hypothetical protein
LARSSASMALIATGPPGEAAAPLFDGIGCWVG